MKGESTVRPEYESDQANTPAQEEIPYEEFDISKFDFTVRDPGENPQPIPQPQSAEAKPKKTAPPPRREEPAPVGEEKKMFLGLPNYAAMDRRALRSKMRRYLRYALRPSGLYENLYESLWGLYLLGCSLFMSLFYLTVGLDWYHAELMNTGRLLAFVLTGGLMGGAASLVFVGLTALTAHLCREDAIRPFRLLSSVAGAWVFPSTILLVGLVLNFFGLSVSMSFGLIALLWWILSLGEVLKDLLGNRMFPILTLMIAWGSCLFWVISVTFRLK